MIRGLFLFINNRLNFSTLKKYEDQDFVVEKIMISACMKILVNYTQSMAIIKTLNLNWKEIVNNLFQVHKTTSGSINEMISLECLIQGTSSIKITII